MILTCPQPLPAENVHTQTCWLPSASHQLDAICTDSCCSISNMCTCRAVPALVGKCMVLAKIPVYSGVSAPAARTWKEDVWEGKYGTACQCQSLWKKSTVSALLCSELMPQFVFVEWVVFFCFFPVLMLAIDGAGCSAGLMIWCSEC